MIKKVATAAAMLSMTAAGGLALASPAWAVPAEQQACALYANAVTQAGNGLIARGGRVGCDVPAEVTVQLKKNISFWVDSTLAAETLSGVTVHLSPRGFCEDRTRYYTYTISNTGNTREGPLNFFC
ncbi:hypothetical protein [Saccharopolyspora phatthalungensis]|uniref:Uncharacterized protein n=1 Tax=Saccharopolyspora phatthalungensis TaxID=664693 RepID=A0A840Q9L4_9PSEU|nr:hypothetical protein [Saccharopolyspora phatthalungensis]MBB5157126.1 hypothetical protein [Saccharopolyspora phatthalungensis]